MGTDVRCHRISLLLVVFVYSWGVRLWFLSRGLAGISGETEDLVVRTPGLLHET